MSKDLEKKSSYKKKPTKKKDTTYMEAKIANQINTNQ